MAFSCLVGMVPSLQSLFKERQKIPDWPQESGASSLESRPARSFEPSGEGGLARGIWIMSKPVVLIPGALRGIGRATAVAFATEGARLVVSGRHEEAGQALAAELCGLGVEAAFSPPHVRPEEQGSAPGEEAI